MHLFSWVNPNTFTELLMGLWNEETVSVLVSRLKNVPKHFFAYIKKKMPYVSSRIHSLSQRSCIFYALNSVIRMTNAVNFRRLEEPVIYLKHDSSVHLMQRRCKNSQLLFYKCVLAKRLHNLKYLCFRSCWAAHRLDQEDLSQSQSRFSFPFSVAIFFSNSAKHDSQHSACVPVFSHSKLRQKKKRN